MSRSVVRSYWVFIAFAAFTTGMAGCGEPTAAPVPTPALGSPHLPLKDGGGVDSLSCLTGYNVSNGIVTCNPT